MISIDTNILFLAINSKADTHAEARAFIESLQDNSRVAVCELVLAELYCLLRNPVLNPSPASSDQATGIIQVFRHHPAWRLLDYPGTSAGIMEEVWQRAREHNFPRLAVYDARLALTLLHHGVTELATCNIRDFQGYGFRRVWNPLLR